MRRFSTEEQAQGKTYPRANLAPKLATKACRLGVAASKSTGKPSCFMAAVVVAPMLPANGRWALGPNLRAAAIDLDR